MYPVLCHLLTFNKAHREDVFYWTGYLISWRTKQNWGYQWPLLTKGNTKNTISLNQKHNSQSPDLEYHGITKKEFLKEHKEKIFHQYILYFPWLQPKHMKNNETLETMKFLEFFITNIDLKI